MEHTDDPQIAKEVAMDHLSENPSYYKYLSDMESQMENDLEKSEHSGLCCMFLFDGIDHPDILHVTHKYFKPFDDKEKVIEILEEYFDQHPFEDIREVFDKEEFFGEEGDIRVLRPASSEKFLIDLKNKLDELEEDKWPEYKPHVTVNANTDVVDIPIVNYVLVQADKILWSLRPLDLEKSEEILQKGAMKRLFGFNPQDMAPEDQFSTARWTVGGSDERYESTQALREGVPQTKDPHARKRALNKLMGSTQVKMINGEPHVMLFRGASDEEAKAQKKKHHIEHKQASSWTPKHDVAVAFRQDHSDHDVANQGPLNDAVRRGFFAAWIPMSSIHSVPFMHGAVIGTKANTHPFDEENQMGFNPQHHEKPMGEAEFANEKEVIVKPGKYQRVTLSDFKNAHPQANASVPSIDSRINARSSEPLLSPRAKMRLYSRPTKKSDDSGKLQRLKQKLESEIITVDIHDQHVYDNIRPFRRGQEEEK